MWTSARSATVCVCVYIFENASACIAAVCISVCDIILGFKLSSVMLSEKQGHVWFRYDWWLWPTYQSADFYIDKPGYKVKAAWSR